jgi:threonine dehydrogenase-like Zn-dependent dehydrogenase
MRAAVIRESRQVDVMTLEDPAPGPREVVIEATGAGPAIQDGLSRVAPGGTFLQFGVASYDTKVTIDPYRIYREEITITGSMAVLHSFERAADLFATGILDPDVFISDRLPLAGYAEALALFERGAGRKIQVVPSRDTAPHESLAGKAREPA